MRLSDGAQSEAVKAWLQALDEELAHTVYRGVAPSDTLEVARNKLQAIIEWHVSLALHNERARRGALLGEWV